MKVPSPIPGVHHPRRQWYSPRIIAHDEHTRALIRVLRLLEHIALEFEGAPIVNDPACIGQRRSR